MKSAIALVLLLLSLSLSIKGAPSLVFPQPALLWQTTWHGAGVAEGSAIGVDSYDHILLTGLGGAFVPIQDYITGVTGAIILKYSSYGDLLWQRIWGAPVGGSVSTSHGLAVDRSDNIYIAGTTDILGAYGYDAFVLKLDTSGDLLWQRTWGGIGLEVGSGVAVDANGFIYVTGYTTSYAFGNGCGDNRTRATCPDFYLLKLDPNGNLLWERAWGGNYTDAGSGVAVDTLGSVYVVGTTNSVVNRTSNGLLTKFDSNGDLIWERSWGGNTSANGEAVGVDSIGNVYVSGVGDSGPFLLKFSIVGNILWERTFTSGDGEGLAVTPSGEAYVTGYDGHSNNALLLQLTPAGELASQSHWGGNWSGCCAWAYGNGVTVDSQGNPIVTGLVNGEAPYSLTSSNYSAVSATIFTASANFTGRDPQGKLAISNGTFASISGSESSNGGAAELFVFKYGHMPILTVHLNVSAGRISLNGTDYENGQVGNPTYGQYVVTATSPDGYTFDHWNSEGGISLVNNRTNPTTIIIKSPASLMATFKTSTAPSPSLSMLTDGFASGFLVGLASALIVTAVILKHRIRQSSVRDVSQS